jgi:nitrate reductase (NAD(P)H)
MVPKPEEFQSSENKSVMQSECEVMYGPYPRAIPVPFLSVRNEGREGDTPDAALVQNAKSMFEMPPDVRDVKTPDEWVPRDGRLVRLTGKHPFNVEPPLSILHEHKFITPSSLHYVRNHGACPKIAWEDHTVLIGGAGVPNKMELTMDQLAAYPPRELPVTLVCAGNRRKEQNMVRQTIGFNWGPSGVATNVWKGVLLRDLLLDAGVSERDMAGKHVEFIGVEDLPNKVGPGPFKDEPWGKLVKYGTSVPLARAMNPAYDILIAYEANGEQLQPDHGFPVRLIVPGYIGGRMIKWLKHINVIPFETKNHYHYVSCLVVAASDETASFDTLLGLVSHNCFTPFPCCTARQPYPSSSNLGGRIPDGRLVVQARVHFQRTQH